MFRIATILLLIPEPNKIRFGGGVAESIFNPVVLAVVVIAGILICTGTRKRAIAAFLAAAVLIPPDQVLVIGSLHFPMLRVLVLFGLVRMVREKMAEKSGIFTGGMNGIDKAVILLGIVAAVNGVLLFPQSAVFIFQVGNLLSAFGSYFLLRHLIRDLEDVKRALKVLAYCAVAVALLMVVEQATGKNPYYAALGGADAATWGSVAVREGHLRATGCFGQPILAGTFGGIVMPLFVGWWYKERKERKDRMLAAVGIVSAVVISFAANSSTALFAILGGFAGLCFWPLRERMRMIRWAIASMLIGLHLVMKAPVWHLISRVSLTQGSDSEHRYQLVNQCILHFSSWWMIGTKDYASWGWDLWDLGNQYVAIADQSGLIPLLSFLAIFVFGFKYLGKTRVRFKGDRKQQFFAWAFGASLLANVVGFFGISYFDQTIVVWYAILAMIGAIYLQQPAKKVVREPVTASAAPAEPVGADLAYASGSSKLLESDFKSRELRIHEI
jgi:hypothetical protein